MSASPQVIQMNFFPQRQQNGQNIIQEQNSISPNDRISKLFTDYKGRTRVHSFWFILFSVCTAMLPCANLALFFFQPTALSKAIDLSTTSLDPKGPNTQFQIYYILIGCYIFIIIGNISYSWQLGTLTKRIKLYLLLDGIVIAMLATDVAYVVLHLKNFCTVYVSTSQKLLDQQLVIAWQYYVIITLVIVTNFVFAGAFRVLMVNVFWKPGQIVTYKIIMAAFSLLYMAAGIVYLWGYDSLDLSVSDFTDQEQQWLYNSTEYLGNLDNWNFTDAQAKKAISQQFQNIPIIYQETNALQSTTTLLSNLMIFYAFANFAFFIQILGTINAKDGTDDLKTDYEFEISQQGKQTGRQ